MNIKILILCFFLSSLCKSAQNDILNNDDLESTPPINVLNQQKTSAFDNKQKQTPHFSMLKCKYQRSAYDYNDSDDDNIIFQKPEYHIIDSVPSLNPKNKMFMSAIVLADHISKNFKIRKTEHCEGCVPCIESACYTTGCLLCGTSALCACCLLPLEFCYPNTLNYINIPRFFLINIFEFATICMQHSMTCCNDSEGISTPQNIHMRIAGDINSLFITQQPTRMETSCT